MNEFVSINDINKYNIIINDSDCSDSFIEGVSRELGNKGIEYSLVRDNNFTDTDNSIIITLDQQYNSGNGVLLFAPFNNTRLGESDGLVLSMKASFIEDEIPFSKISCGKVGFSKNSNGDVLTSRPTDTEEVIKPVSDASFVTISFGTARVDAKRIGDAIASGIARFVNYLDNYDNNTDLIYRATAYNNISDVAKFFQVDESSLKNYNNIKGDILLDGQTIVNPNVSNMDVFDSNKNFGISNLNKSL